MIVRKARVVSKHRPLLSILVPYTVHGDDPAAEWRRANWNWLRQYLTHALPDAEIVVGRDVQRPFSKSVAVNRAARKAHGDVYAIIDADALIRSEVVAHCARTIAEWERRQQRIWFVPYRSFVRLNETGTELVLESPPRNPIPITEPPPDWAVEGVDDASGPWHRHGAGAIIVSKAAFNAVGGMDERFRGWGAEDGSFVHALQTLWCPYQTTPNDLFALWHPRTGHNFTDRTWHGQTTGNANSKLASAYHNASGNHVKMRALVGAARPRRYSLLRK